MKAKILPSIIMLIPFLSGCSKTTTQPYFPLAKGNTWSYTFRSGLQTFVEEFTVTRKVQIAGTQGWELSSPMGNSRATWDKGKLLINQLPTTRFYPELILLDPSEPNSERSWNGSIESNGLKQKASANIIQKKERYKIGSRSYNTIKVTLNLNSGPKKVEVVTWFAKDIGILSQQQRTNRYLDCAMEYLSGPDSK